MTGSEERGYAVVAGFCVGAVAGCLVWFVVLGLAGAESGDGARYWVAPIFGIVRPAVEQGTGTALLGSSALWLFLIVSVFGVSAAAFVVRTLVPDSAPTPIALGVALVPVVLPVVLFLLAPTLPSVSRGDPSNFVYYGLVWHVPHAGVLLLAGWGGARAAGLRREVVHG